MSRMLTAPAMIPAAAGAKLTETVQLAPGLSDTGQLLDAEKSPVASILLMSSAAFPELLRKNVCGELVVLTSWLANTRLGTETPAAGLASPVPVKLTSCNPEAPLSTMVNSPWRAPAAVGAKVTEIVHCPPTAKPGTQLSISVKSPRALTLETASGEVPEFVSVTPCGVLLVPTFCGTKLRPLAETEAPGSPIPTPCNGRFCVPPALSVIVRPPVALPGAVGENDTLNVQFEAGARPP